jgi:hypothetical protein
MEDKYSRDWWLWQMYRQVAEYVNSPSDISEARLRSLMLEYRKGHQKNGKISGDRERAVDLG